MINWRSLALAAALACPGWATAQTFADLTDPAAGITASPGLYSTGLAWGDYDGDGDLDLYVTNWCTKCGGASPVNGLYRNEGNGVFSEVAAQTGVDNNYHDSSAAAWGDFDNDGDLDLYVADFYQQDYLYENRGVSFVEVGRARQSIDLIKMGNATSVAWGDYDNDGWLDIYLGKYYYDNDLYHNNGDGTFSRVADLGVGDKRDTEEAAWVDYDNDGDLDLYVANREQENALYRNELGTGGTFADVADSLGVANKEIGQCQAWGDYDNDGDLDLYVGNVGANALYRNDLSAGGTFVDVAAGAGVQLWSASWITAAAAWADCDGDGDLDLYLASGGDKQAQPDLLFANNGDGTFHNATVEAQLQSAPAAHSAAGWGDYDGNGAPDLYVTDGWGGGNRLFQNNTPGSRFIRVQVRGKGPAANGSNRDGIGAQVSLFDAGTRLLRAYRQVLSGPSATEVIFGAPAGPYDVEVYFPASRQKVTVGTKWGGDLLKVVEEP